MEEWYYQRGGATFGPMTASSVLALRQRGSLSDETLLRRGLNGDWIPLLQAGLNEAIAALPPLVPPPAMVQRPPSAQRPGTARVVPDGPSGWMWFFGISAVMLTTSHALVLAVNGASFVLAMLPPLELPDVAVTLFNFCSEALILSSLFYFVSIIIWTGAAFASLARVYGENHMPHGSGAGFWWIVPFANLVIPFRCLRVIRHLSRRLRDAVGTETSPSLSVLGIQVAYIATTVFRVLDKVSSPSAPMFSTNAENANPFFAMMLDFTLAAFALQLAIFILINLIQQVRLFREARPEE